MLKRIKNIAAQIAPRLIEIRRHIHAYPELSGQEYQTSTFVSGVLSSCGIYAVEGIGKTGVIGEIKGNGRDNRILGIRTDMDALPVQECTGLEFSSRQTGTMHACGHDVHTTIGLGTAMVLSQLLEDLPGKVRFLFQPAEEIAQGANWMVKDGAMNNLNALLSLHAMPSLPA